MNLHFNEDVSSIEKYACNQNTGELHLEGKNSPRVAFPESMTEVGETSFISITPVKLRSLSDVYAKCNLSIVELRNMKMLPLIKLRRMLWTVKLR